MSDSEPTPEVERIDFQRGTSMTRPGSSADGMVQHLRGLGGYGNPVGPEPAPNYPGDDKAPPGGQNSSPRAVLDGMFDQYQNRRIPSGDGLSGQRADGTRPVPGTARPAPHNPDAA